MTETITSKHQESKQDSKQLKFELIYCFKAFTSDYDTLQTIEVIKSDSNKYKSPVFLFPGFEGKLKFMEDLARNLNRTVYCLQYPFERGPTLNELVDRLFTAIKKHIPADERINIVAHSLGALPVVKVVERLECENKNVRLCLIDCTPTAIREVVITSFGDMTNESQFENDYLMKFLEFMKIRNTDEYRCYLNLDSNWETKLTKILEIAPEHPSFSKTDCRIILNGFFHCLKGILQCGDNFKKLNAETTLIRSTIKVLPFPDDYETTKYFKNPVKTLFVDGHHFNIVKLQTTADLLNTELGI
ncbi:hypothetical protein PGB90_005091 [Kerria lacca]